MSDYRTHPTTAPGAPEPEFAVMQQERDTAKIVLLGGVAAGIVSGLLVLLSEREERKPPPSKLDQARLALEEAAANARKQGLKLEGDLAGSVASLRKDSESAAQRARKRSKKTSRKTRKEAEATMASIASLLAVARNEARNRYDAAGKQMPDVSGLAEQVRANAEHVAEDSRKKGRELRKQATRDAAKAKKQAGSLVDMLKARAVEAEQAAERYALSTLVPKLKDLEHEAATVFETGKSTTKEKTSGLIERAEKDLLPQAKKKATEVLEHAEKDVLPEVKKKAAEVVQVAEKDVLPQAKERAEKARAELDEAAHVAAEKLSAVKETAGEQAHEAGEAVKRGGRETRSLLVWLGIAGALVYNVFLNEEQQRKVRELGAELFGEAKAMYSDIKSDGSSLSA